MNLSRLHRQSIAQGSTTLAFPFDPSCPKHGEPVCGPCCVVLHIEPERRVTDQLGNVTVVPPRPVHWIEITAVQRHRKGHWQVRFNSLDLREHPRFLARGGAYTSSRFRAVDEAEAVPQKFQDQLSKEVSKEWELVRRERAAAAQQERWRFKRERRRVAARLSDAA